MRAKQSTRFSIVLATGALAQQEGLPSVRLVEAPSLTMPGAIHSNVPMAWRYFEFQRCGI